MIFLQECYFYTLLCQNKIYLLISHNFTNKNSVKRMEIHSVTRLVVQPNEQHIR